MTLDVQGPPFPFPAAPVFHANEDLEGWLDCTASVLHVTRESLVKHVASRMELDDGAGAGTVPAPIAAALLREARKSNPEAGAAGEVPAALRLRTCARGGYCPLCFNADLARGHLPYFRREWSNAYVTHCPWHLTPLFQWPWMSKEGTRELPMWLVAVFREGRLTYPKTQAVRRPFETHLRLARNTRKWASGFEDPGAVAWRQQLWFESNLSSPGFAAGIAGSTPADLLRVVKELAVVFAGGYQVWTETQASYAAEFMGPAWLFAKGERLPKEDLDLRRLGPPAYRRSVLAVTFRTLMGFAADIGSDKVKCIPNSVGQTALTVDLDKFSSSAKDWLVARAQRWPAVCQIGVQQALRNRDQA